MANLWALEEMDFWGYYQRGKKKIYERQDLAHERP